MYRIGILSDIHADVDALRDALAQTQRLRCNLVVCAGDLVEYGPRPDATIALLRERAIPCIQGNHDRWAVQNWNETLRTNAVSRRLTLDSLQWLASLPRAWYAEIDGIPIAMRHGDWWGDEPYPGQVDARRMRLYFDKLSAEPLIVGHVHVPYEVRWAGKALLNPGAILRHPLPDSSFVADAPLGTFGVLDLPSRRFTVHAAVDGAEVDILRRELAP